MYNPDAAPAGTPALSKASRILPIVTTAHLPSAACDAYWPEIYWNQPVVAEPRRNPYSDSPAPKTFQNASPADPQLFSRMSDFARELLHGERSGKYSPIEVAQHLEDLAIPGVDTSREGIDIEIQAGLGRFFAAKFRSGVLYSIYEQTGDRRAIVEALKLYRNARAAWAQIAERTKVVYAADLSASDKISERGQWADRLAGIDQDIVAMEARVASAQVSSDSQVASAIEHALSEARREAIPFRHTPPQGFRAKADVPLEIAGRATSARLYYRRVNQAERWESVEMEGRKDTFRGSIPAAYTDSPYPLQYYFELNRVCLYPGFGRDWMNLPYIVLRRTP
jgi:hypothetical protein